MVCDQDQSFTAHFFGSRFQSRQFPFACLLIADVIRHLKDLRGLIPLAEYKIGIFAVSTYNTDYILVKEENYERALTVLASEGYTVV